MNEDVAEMAFDGEKYQTLNRIGKTLYSNIAVSPNQINRQYRHV